MITHSSLQIYIYHFPYLWFFQMYLSHKQMKTPHMREACVNYIK